MDDQARDELRKRNSTRALRCSRCGSLSTTTADGSKCGGMPGILYKVCGACGHADAQVSRRRSRGLA